MVVDHRGLTGRTALRARHCTMATKGSHQLVESPCARSGRPSCRCRCRRFCRRFRCINGPTASSAQVFFAALADWLLFCSCAPVNLSSISRLVVLGNPIPAMCFWSTSDFTFSSPLTFCASSSWISHRALKPQFLGVYAPRLSDATPCENSQRCACVCSEHDVECIPTAKILSGALLWMACSSASHDDNATGLLRGAPVLGDPKPDVLVLLDLQPAQSESVCAVRMVSNASNLNSCLILWFSRSFKTLRNSHDFPLTLLCWFLLCAEV